MKNVAILISRLRGGGAERVAGLLSKHLSDMYNVFLFVAEEENIVYEYGGEIIYLASECVNDSMSIVDAIRICKRKYSIDVSISFQQGMNFYNIRSYVGEKVVLSERTTASVYEPTTIKQKELIKIIYPYSDKVVCVSYGTKADLIKCFDIDESKLDVIYNFINRERNIAMSNESIDADVSDFIGDSKLILNVGRLSDDKNQKMIIEAFSDLVRNGNDLKLIILGSGGLEKELSEFIIQSGMENNIKMIPYTKNPFLYYKLAYCIVTASRLEGLPNILLESMLAGTPVIAADCLSGPRELIAGICDYDKLISRFECYERGILVELDGNNTIEYLNSAIAKMISDKEYRDNCSKNVADYMQNFYYSNDELLEKWIKVIEEKQDTFYQVIDRYDFSNVIIFGAGKVAKEAYDICTRNGINVICFVVSSLSNNPSVYCDLPVISIDDVEKINDVPIIIGIGGDFENILDMIKKNTESQYFWPEEIDVYFSYKHNANMN